ncbi:uncharacterized protein PpBr36_09939 [Pyricularia pennisetigena]|uniref:uncharacterized protein n=1 Tax=Pyricularia pennisetigena TaxID=1578925 RepID=UPI0011524C72|nr:uncharacterized protein PpBr36_09939 [Pyricularia pennisetigena]TLS22395.1 hypothetical protein PpBr36_09939 [Pyricularia pennisetigena]
MHKFSLLSFLTFSSLLFDGAVALGSPRNGHSDGAQQISRPGSPRGTAAGNSAGNYQGPKTPPALYHGSRRNPKSIRKEGGLMVQKKPDDVPQTYDDHVHTSRHHIYKGEFKTEFISFEDDLVSAWKLLAKYYPAWRTRYIYQIDTTGIEDWFQNVNALYQADGKVNRIAPEEREWITRNDIPWSAIEGWYWLTIDDRRSDFVPNPTRYDPLPAPSAPRKKLFGYI